MPTFVIEREIPGADKLRPEELQAIAAKSNEVVAGLGVPYRWITSYVAGDKIYCVHEAQDAETITKENFISGTMDIDFKTRTSTDTSGDFGYAKGSLAWAPGGGFTASVAGKATTDGAYQATFKAAKTIK